LVSPIESWLRKRFAEEAAVSVLAGALAICLGVLVVMITFWLTYAVVWIAVFAVSGAFELTGARKIHLPHWLMMSLAAGFLVLLFHRHFQRSPWDRDDYSAPDATPGDGFDNWGAALAVQGGALGSVFQLLRTPTASARFILEILDTGPRLLTGARGLFRRAQAVRRLDPAGCAWVLTMLSSRPGAMPRDELIAAWPQANWPRLWAELRLIDGLVFLEKGISLTQDLRSELLPLLGGVQH